MKARVRVSAAEKERGGQAMFFKWKKAVFAGCSNDTLLPKLIRRPGAKNMLLRNSGGYAVQYKS